MNTLKTKAPKGNRGFQKSSSRNNNTDINTILQALQYIDNSDRKKWVNIGGALLTALGNEGFTVWDNWSKGANNYNVKDCLSVWKSLKPNKINIGTLFYYAKVNGYKPATTVYSRASKANYSIQSERPEQALINANQDDDKKYSEGAKKAKWLWENSTIAEIDNHQYLINKQVKAHGIKLYKGSLVIPIMDGDNLASLQFINSEGAKTFLGGGKVSGNFFTFGDINLTDYIYLCEGYATGASAFEAYAYNPYATEIRPVVVCFNAGNIANVASRLSYKYPNKKLVILADDDKAGLEGAYKAQKLTGAVVVTARGY